MALAASIVVLVATAFFAGGFPIVAPTGASCDEATSPLTLIVALLVAGNARSADTPTQIEVEQTTTVRVGQLAVLHVPDARLYNPSEINGAWRDVLTRVRRSGRTVTFRAVKTGPGVIILSPNVPDGECISCKTLHYFIRVIN